MSWRSMVFSVLILRVYRASDAPPRPAEPATWLRHSLNTNAAPRSSIYRSRRRDNRPKLLLVRRTAPLDRFDRPGVVATHRGRGFGRSRSALDERELARLRVLAAPLLRLRCAH